MNPFQEKPKKIEKTYESWKGLSPASYDKHETDPYTKVRIILMNGTEFEAEKFSTVFPATARTTISAAISLC